MFLIHSNGLLWLQLRKTGYHFIRTFKFYLSHSLFTYFPLLCTSFVLSFFLSFFLSFCVLSVIFISPVLTRFFLLPLRSFCVHSAIRHDLLLRYVSRNWALLHILQVEDPEQAWLTEAFRPFPKFRTVPQIISRPLLSTSFQCIFSQPPRCHSAGAAYSLFALHINRYRFVFPRHDNFLFIEASRSHSDTPHSEGLL